MTHSLGFTKGVPAARENQRSQGLRGAFPRPGASSGAHGRQCPQTSPSATLHQALCRHWVQTLRTGLTCHTLFLMAQPQRVATGAQVSAQVSARCEHVRGSRKGRSRGLGLEKTLLGSRV